jgi:hypothetical protein
MSTIARSGLCWRECDQLGGVAAAADHPYADCSSRSPTLTKEDVVVGEDDAHIRLTVLRLTASRRQGLSVSLGHVVRSGVEPALATRRSAADEVRAEDQCPVACSADDRASAPLGPPSAVVHLSCCSRSASGRQRAAFAALQEVLIAANQLERLLWT